MPSSQPAVQPQGNNILTDETRGFEHADPQRSCEWRRFSKDKSAPRPRSALDGIPEGDNFHNSRGDGTLNPRPTFGQWVKASWLDVLTLLALGGFGLLAFLRPSAQIHLFPIYSPNGELLSPHLAYPYRKAHIPTWLSVVLSLAIPLAVFLLLQIRIRSFWDLNNAVFGLLYALLTAAVFQVTLKWLVGSPRPHFLSVCQPDVPSSGPQSGVGFQNLLYDATVCTGTPALVKEALQSFPSGHTAAAFSTGLFTALYLNAKLKLCADYQPAYWKMVLTLLPLLEATLIACSLIMDGYHHWHDVVAGALIGILTAFTSYRMMYASIWDYRRNHVPLMRDAAYAPKGGGYNAAAAAAAAAEEGRARAVATQKVGWTTRGSEKREDDGRVVLQTSPQLQTTPGIGAAQVDGMFCELAGDRPLPSLED